MCWTSSQGPRQWEERSFRLPQHPKAPLQLCAASRQHQNKPDIEIQSHSLVDVQSCTGLSLLTERHGEVGGGRGSERGGNEEHPWDGSLRPSISGETTRVSGHAQRAPSRASRALVRRLALFPSLVCPVWEAVLGSQAHPQTTRGQKEPGSLWGVAQAQVEGEAWTRETPLPGPAWASLRFRSFPEWN